jgi:hypothetical protein
MKTLVSLRLVIAIVVLIVVAGVVLWQTQKPATQATSFTITRTSSGGLSGRGDGKDFTLKSEDLSSATQQAVIDKINRAQFFSMNDHYAAPMCADIFVNTIKIQLNGDVKTVTYDGCGQKDLPKALPELDGYLLGLVD